MDNTPTIANKSFLSTVLRSFKDAKCQRPSQRINAVSSVMIKGVCTERPAVSDDQLMFDQSAIHAAKNPLAKLFRMIMYRLRMTPDEYKAKTMEYGRSIGKTSTQMNTQLSNSKKAIYGNTLTVMQLERNLLHAGYDILDMSVTIQNHTTGEITEYKVSDTAQLDRLTNTELDQIFVDDEDD